MLARILLITVAILVGMKLLHGIAIATGQMTDPTWQTPYVAPMPSGTHTRVARVLDATSFRATNGRVYHLRGFVPANGCWRAVTVKHLRDRLVGHDLVITGTAQNAVVWAAGGEVNREMIRSGLVRKAGAVCPGV